MESGGRSNGRNVAMAKAATIIIWLLEVNTRRTLRAASAAGRQPYKYPYRALMRRHRYTCYTSVLERG